MSQPEIQHRQFSRIVRKAEDGTDRTVFVASTDAADRYQDIVDQGTWKLDHYRANPVVLVDHSYSATTTVAAGKVAVVDGALELEIAKWSAKPLAQEVRQDVEDGIIQAVSVGFRPGRTVARSQLPKEDGRYKEAGHGMVFYDCELLEVSIVAVPANPHALAKSADDAGLDALAARVVDRLLSDPAHRDALADVSRDTAEASSPSGLRRLFGV